MNILALCGSIRKESSNYALLLALRSFFSESTKWDIFEIKQLPFFDPQLQFSSNLPSIVASLRDLAKESDYIVISTPEYAHGIPGILKNALEWLICEESMKKKVAVLIGSPSGGEFVKDYLIETLHTMDLITAKNLTLVVQTARNQITSEGEITEEGLRLTLEKFANEFVS